MRILNLTQGSQQWKAHRAWPTKNASDAPAMLDESPYCSRSELLHRLATGIVPEVDAGTQRRFDDGHAVEALLRKVGEERLGEPLHAFVGVADFDEHLSASFDGCTFVSDVTLECKLLNARLRAAFADMETIAPEHRERSAGQCLPIDYRIQMEQQLRVAEAERALFMAGELRDDGSLGDVLSCWYYPDDALWGRIQAGWLGFAEDVATYVAPPAAERVTAAPIEALPAVSVQVQGSLAVRSNLDVFGAKLQAFVAGIPKRPSTDQEFADAEAACKALKKAEEALDGAESQAIAQASSIEELTRTVSDLRNVARTARLATEKLVKARKEQMRGEEVARGRSAIVAHVQKLNEALGGDFVPVPAVDFGGCISGLKTIDSIRNAIDTAVARGKIEAGDIANAVTRNQAAYREMVLADQQQLFPDLKTLLLKPHDDFKAQIAARTAAFVAAQERKLEAERERIRREEQERAEREAREKVAAEQRAAQAATPAPTAAPAFVAPAAPAANTVVPIQRPTEKPTLKLGDVCARLGFTMTGAFVRQLGVAGTPGERGSVLFTEHDFTLICESLHAHITTVQAKRAA